MALTSRDSCDAAAHRMPVFEEIDDARCRSFQSYIELVGRRWTPGILLGGMRGATRFGEYRSFVAGISDRLLAQRLRELETAGLMERVVTPTTPVTIEYLLTDRGRRLMQILRPLVEWGLEADDQAY